MNPRLLEVFFDVQRGLPRQGPGDRESTLKALGLCAGAPDNPAVLDIGCGPGAQTLVLAGAGAGRVVAVDTCEEYLEQLRERARRAGFADRVEARLADMADLDFPDASFDLVWCEGAAYNMGVAAALRAWRGLLRDRGCLAFSELIWLVEDPPAPVAAFFGEEYPAMTNRETIVERSREAGYEPVGDFTLPDSAWWDDYYGPLEAKLPSLKQKYAGDEQALAVVAMTETEIATRRRYGGAYGYQFFVVRKMG